MYLQSSRYYGADLHLLSFTASGSSSFSSFEFPLCSTGPSLSHEQPHRPPLAIKRVDIHDSPPAVLGRYSSTAVEGWKTLIYNDTTNTCSFAMPEMKKNTERRMGPDRQPGLFFLSLCLCLSVIPASLISSGCPAPSPCLLVVLRDTIPQWESSCS